MQFTITIQVKADTQENAIMIQNRLQKFVDAFPAKEILNLSKKMLDKINTIKLLF